VRSTNEERAGRLSRAIVATISGDIAQLSDLFTVDVVASGPGFQAISRDQLAEEIGQRLHAFSDRKVSVSPLDVSGHQACVEWVASGTHSGEFGIPDGTEIVFAPTGRRVRLRAISVAEFDGDQICSLRSYWDGANLFEHLTAGDRD
jgi:ketosteroid isomerase-like protein